MNNLPRQMLRRILDKHGEEIGGDARRCESLLNDLCGAYRREINVLVAAIEERVPLDLSNGSGSIPMELLLKRLEKRLEQQTAMTAEAASWSVESWALALNLMTDAEIAAREKRSASASPISNSGAVQPNDSVHGGIAQNVEQTKPASSTKTQTAAPQSKPRPPVIRQPAKTPTPLPPVFSPTNNPPAVQPPSSPQTANPPVIVKKKFGLFRGCLLILFILGITSVALFLGVPYAIEKMRETQRERDSEPPRFPAR